MRTDLNSECKYLKRIIDDLDMGRETCEIRDDHFTLGDVLGYLRGYLQELEDLNKRIIENGNTPELLKEVHDKYTELWVFQLSYTVRSLPSVIGGLLCYPKDYC